MGFECSVERPWGIHQKVYNDSDCPRCGWTAPGPVGDARLDALDAAEEAAAFAAEFVWLVQHGNQPANDRHAIAA
ncbi:MAG TPA: hypothetical protein VIA98_01070 [Allosphingosinicella sp.]|jgi:hypothetical protein